ncbi:hypothetical protein BCR44DRAFT_1433788, partial [Catenaria anguillulae PL171]
MSRPPLGSGSGSALPFSLPSSIPPPASWPDPDPYPPPTGVQQGQNRFTVRHQSQPSSVPAGSVGSIAFQFPPPTAQQYPYQHPHQPAHAFGFGAPQAQGYPPQDQAHVPGPFTLNQQLFALPPAPIIPATTSIASTATPPPFFQTQPQPQPQPPPPVAADPILFYPDPNYQPYYPAPVYSPSIASSNSAASGSQHSSRANSVPLPSHSAGPNAAASSDPYLAQITSPPPQFFPRTQTRQRSNFRPCSLSNFQPSLPTRCSQHSNDTRNHSCCCIDTCTIRKARGTIFPIWTQSGTWHGTPVADPAVAAAGNPTICRCEPPVCRPPPPASTAPSSSSASSALAAAIAPPPHQQQAKVKFAPLFQPPSTNPLLAALAQRPRITKPDLELWTPYSTAAPLLARDCSWRIKPFFEIVSMRSFVQLSAQYEQSPIYFSVADDDAAAATVLANPDLRVVLMPAFLDAVYFSANHKINGNRCAALLDARIITSVDVNHARVLTKHTCHPIDITDAVRKSETQARIKQHLVKVAAPNAGPAPLTVLVAVVKRIPVDDVVRAERIEQNMLSSSSSCSSTSSTSSDLNDDDDDLLLPATALVPLKDPVLHSRIRVPLRSTHCTHPECFDAAVFFTMNAQTPTWVCPYCDVTMGAPMSPALRTQMMGRGELRTVVGFGVAADVVVDGLFERRRDDDDEDEDADEA